MRIDLHTASRWLLAALMTAVGVYHFVDPAPFERIMPRALPAPRLLVFVSGAFEVLGGLGLLWSRSRRYAAWGLIALYLAVFPANINMAVNRISLAPGAPPPPDWMLWARLPLQAVLIYWAYRFTRKRTAER